MLPACYVDGLKSAGEYFLPFEEVHLKKAKDLGRLFGRLSFPGCLLQIRLFFPVRALIYSLTFEILSIVIHSWNKLCTDIY